MSSIVHPNAQAGAGVRVGNAPTRGRTDPRRRPGPPLPRTPARGSPPGLRGAAHRCRQRPCAGGSKSQRRSATPSPAAAPLAPPADRANAREQEHRGAATPGPTHADRAAPAARTEPRNRPCRRSTAVHEDRRAGPPPAPDGPRTTPESGSGRAAPDDGVQNAGAENTRCNEAGHVAPTRSASNMGPRGRGCCACGCASMFHVKRRPRGQPDAA